MVAGEGKDMVEIPDDRYQEYKKDKLERRADKQR